MKAIIASGKLGRITGGSAFVCWDRSGAYYTESPWRGTWAHEGGSVLINQSIHTLDLLRYLAGELTLSACSMSAKRLADIIETEDTCDMLLCGPGGERFLMYCSVCGAGNRPVQIHLTLEQGELLLDGQSLTIRDADSVQTEDFSSETVVGKDYWGVSHELLISDFYHRIQTGEPPFIPPEDALETMRLVDQAYHWSGSERRRPE